MTDAVDDGEPSRASSSGLASPTKSRIFTTLSQLESGRKYFAHQRAVTISTLQSGGGRHFASSAATAADHALSSPCEAFDFFISHAWHAPRSLKWLALLYRFSLAPALVAAHAVAIATVILTITGDDTMLPTIRVERSTWLELGIREEAGGTFVFWAHVVGPSAFLVVLFSWQHIRSLLESVGVVARSRCFLDKLCIHQTDERLKCQGIDSIGSYLQSSKAMLVLWSPEYFSRLWTCFEMGVFLDACTAHPESRKRLEIQPLFEAASTFAIGAIACFQMSMYNVGTNYLLSNDTVTLVDPRAAVAGVVFLSTLVAGLVGYPFFRREYHKRSQLERQIADFTLERAQCSVEDDRQLVENVLAGLYTKPDESKQAGTARFAAMVRAEVAKAVHAANLTSCVPSFRAVFLILTMVSMYSYDDIAMLFRIPNGAIAAVCLAVNESRVAASQLRPDDMHRLVESAAPLGDVLWIRAATVVYLYVQASISVFSYTVLVGTIATAFPPRRTRWQNAASTISASLIGAAVSTALTALTRMWFYAVAPCHPRLSTICVLFPLTLVGVAIIKHRAAQRAAGPMIVDG